MAATVIGAKLTEAHRLAQANIAASTVASVRGVWKNLEPSNLRGSTARWLSAVEPIVVASHEASSVLAANYTAALRNVELGAGGYKPLVAEALNREALRTSMVVTGPVSIRNNVARSMPLPVAMQRAEAASSAAASRHALNGGRETILRNVQADRKAVGWQRITSAGACAFCAMLASRGAVYRTSGTVDFHCHDGCHCVAEPVYVKGQPMAETSQYYRNIYNASTAGKSPNQLAAFRRALQGARPPTRPAVELLRPATLKVAAPKALPTTKFSANRGIHPSTAIKTMPTERTAVGKATRTALDDIAKVHRIPEGMPTVPVVVSRAQSYGVYEYGIFDGLPRKIGIRTSGDHLQGTFTHEFGHYLDHQANLANHTFARATFSSAPAARNGDALMTAFYEAVDASPTKKLLAAERGTTAAYYNGKDEVWARAYAQWIGERSGSEVLKEEMRVIRQRGGLRGLSQWSEEEFGPIAEAMDAIFKEAGLM